VSLFECWSVMQLDVSSSVHGQSQLSATISWSPPRGSTDMPAKWQVSVKNLTWIQNDDWYREWLYDVDVGECLQHHPLHTLHTFTRACLHRTLRMRCKFSVLNELKSCTTFEQQCSQSVLLVVNSLHWLLFGSSTVFTAVCLLVCQHHKSKVMSGF